MKILTNEDICLLLDWKINRNAAVPSWIRPDGKLVPTVPFTTSLDIQEKYLWPWLGKKGCDISIMTRKHGESREVVFYNTATELYCSQEHKDAATAFNLVLSEYVSST